MKSISCITKVVELNSTGTFHSFGTTFGNVLSQNFEGCDSTPNLVVPNESTQHHFKTWEIPHIGVCLSVYHA